MAKFSLVYLDTNSVLFIFNQLMQSCTKEERKEHPDILKQQKILQLVFAIYVFSSSFLSGLISYCYHCCNCHN